MIHKDDGLAEENINQLEQLIMKHREVFTETPKEA